MVSSLRFIHGPLPCKPVRIALPPKQWFFFMRFLALLYLAFLVLTAQGFGQVIVAHRGASHDAPENTLAAFRLAWEQGSDGVEGDFYLTKDNQIVCIHDRDTNRTAGVKRVVEDSTFAELRELDYGGWKDRRWKGEKIPTFAEVLRTVPAGKLFVIELKSKQKIVPVLASQLRELDTQGIDLLIISFDAATVAACRQQIPDVRAHWLTSFSQPRGAKGFEPTADSIARTVRETRASGVGMKGQRQVVNADFILDLKRHGCSEFHVWTIDALQDAEYFQELGAYGITTNRPALIGKIRDVVAP